MNFTYEEDKYRESHILKLVSDHKAEVRIHFDGFDPEFVEVNDSQVDLKVTDDTTNAMFVIIDGKPISLAEICDNAASEIIDIAKEVDIERRYEASHAKAMSSPRLTGRI